MYLSGLQVMIHHRSPIYTACLRWECYSIVPPPRGHCYFAIKLAAKLVTEPKGYRCKRESRHGGTVV